jgi:endonuclease/exonuclease/phosphatase family metal-dependent hydrolase
MRKQTLIILTVVGLLMMSQVLAYAATQDKGEHKKTTIEVVNLNILNGIACDPPVTGDGDQCRVRDRIALLMQHIVAAGCPDLVTLQENVTSKFVQRTATEVVGPLDDTVKLIKHRLPKLAVACGFPYRVVFDRQARRPPEPGRGIDEEMILSRYPVLSWKVMPLYSPFAPFFFRHVLYARIDHPIGPVDVFTTHLASGRRAPARKRGIAVRVKW